MAAKNPSRLPGEQSVVLQISYRSLSGKIWNCQKPSRCKKGEHRTKNDFKKPRGPYGLPSLHSQQLQLQQNLQLGSPSLVIAKKKAEDAGAVSEDDGLPRSPPEIATLHDILTSSTSKVCVLSACPGELLTARKIWFPCILARRKNLIDKSVHGYICIPLFLHRRQGGAPGVPSLLFLMANSLVR